MAAESKEEAGGGSSRNSLRALEIWRRAAILRKTSKSSSSSRGSLPSPLKGGTLIDDTYNTPKGYASLCRAVFEDYSGRSILPKINKAIGRTNVVVGGWRCQKKNICTREITYTAPQSEKTGGAYQTYESQTISNPIDGVCLVDATVRTPSVPYGTRFATRVRYVIQSSGNIDTGNEASVEKISPKKDSEHKSKMVVSFDTMWTNGRPVLAPAIKRAIRKQISKNFKIIDNVIQANTKL